MKKIKNWAVSRSEKCFPNTMKLLMINSKYRVSITISHGSMTHGRLHLLEIVKPTQNNSKNRNISIKLLSVVKKGSKLVKMVLLILPWLIYEDK